MGIFSKKTEEQKEALRELKTYTNNKRLRYREIIPRYGVMKEETDDLKCYNHTNIFAGGICHDKALHS